MSNIYVSTTYAINHFKHLIIFQNKIYHQFFILLKTKTFFYEATHASIHQRKILSVMVGDNDN